MSRQAAVTPENAPTVQQLLAFYLEAGVDCALAEEPIDRVSASELISAASRPAQPPTARPAGALPVARTGAGPGTEAAIMSAREAARTAPTHDALRALLVDLDGCAMQATDTSLVFAHG